MRSPVAPATTTAVSSSNPCGRISPKNFGASPAAVASSSSDAFASGNASIDDGSGPVLMRLDGNAAGTSPTATLCHWVCSTRYGDLPAEVRQETVTLFDFRVDPGGTPYFLEASLYCSYAPSSVLVVMAASITLFLLGCGTAGGVCGSLKLPSRPNDAAK